MRFSKSLDVCFEHRKSHGEAIFLFCNEANVLLIKHSIPTFDAQENVHFPLTFFLSVLSSHNAHLFFLCRNRLSIRQWDAWGWVLPSSRERRSPPQARKESKLYCGLPTKMLKLESICSMTTLVTSQNLSLSLSLCVCVCVCGCVDVCVTICRGCAQVYSTTDLFSSLSLSHTHTHITQSHNHTITP